MRIPTNSAILATLVALLEVVGCRSQDAPTGQADAGTTKVTPFLMFQDGRAEEAIRWYVEVFGSGRVVSIERYGPNSVGAKEESVQKALFEIHGQRVMVTESPIQHVFGFTPAISLFVDFDSEAELDRVFSTLSEGGEVMMPLDRYFFSRSNTSAICSDRIGQRRECSGLHAGSEGVFEGFERVVAAEFQRAVDAHEDRLRVRATV